MTRYCISCQSFITYVNTQGYHVWHKHNDGYLCHKCYCRICLNPKITYEYRKKYTGIHIRKIIARRLNFRDKRVYVKQPARRGICYKCGKKIGDEYVNCKGQIAIKEKQIYLIYNIILKIL